MTLTEQVWRRQYADVCEALRAAGAVQTAEDGFRWVDETKVPKVAAAYRQLSSVGYYNGWL